ncbi:putative AlkP superfamily pyrophosphatase or phosphodiesterase [Novosphingobium chloroacetimidivorans]|uniref:Alkaline phosphatase n=1 Tax=Novosphingobium chloroacetimidivorans TaxID=1428314 RepID=A0A7W7K7I2_9SPHN|nr:alkaline phosphatase family protein [Novosphingobium chloroacetimidivorans]MBB4857650.1 putative AlkP superfamily pyrophosphatase or phosphodiesterase [Novosphingobium chloroacetimidivorans]
MRAARVALASLASALALTVALPSMAQETPPPVPATPAPAPAPKPRLILAISIDQFSADLFAQYREHFTGGFARLLTGAVFPQGFQSHAATETCPGHSTLLTGAHPSRTGVIANSWYDAKLGREVYCAENERDPRSSAKEPVVSNWHLKVPTLGDLMKRANPAALNVAVSAKDRAAVMMSGHDVDAAYWWLGKGFTTYQGRAVSAAVQAQNVATGKLIDAGAPAFSLPQWCEKVDRATPVKDFTIGTYRFPLKAGDTKSFGRTPRIDAATGELAVRLVDEMGLGKDDVTDVLSVSFSATDYVGHAYGTEGAEMCIQLAQLDQTLGRLFAELDRRGVDFLAVLSADHGGIDAPERLKLQGFASAQRIDPALTAEQLSAAISRDTGVTAKSGQLLHGAGASGDIWFAPGLTPAQQKKVTAALLKRLAAHPQVAAVYDAKALAKLPVPQGNPQDWTVEQRVRASFDPERSGQVMMMTRRGVVPGDPQPGYTATHGSPWDYDRRVPMLFWRKGMAGFEQPDPVETVDIAPTLAAAIGLAEPVGTWDGRCLDIDGSAADTCRR